MSAPKRTPTSSAYCQSSHKSNYFFTCIRSVFDIGFFEDFDVTTTFTTQVPVFKATNFPALTAQYLAEDEGTLAATFAPFATFRFAVFARLVKLAGLLAVRIFTFVIGEDNRANAVEGMLDLGAEPENLKAIIGPTISAKNFIATQERFDEVKDIEPSAAVKLADGQLAVDIRKGVKHQLAQYQIKTTDLNICTFDTAEMFSFRRDPVTGRNATVAWLSE